MSSACYAEHKDGQERPRKLNPATINQKAVGLLLKANGKRYYASSELCPGGIFLTRPVNENCLCYNGIFQIVRECCSPGNTRIHSDNLEWRMDFKCGTSPSSIGNDSHLHPIRAILPISKPYNRFGSTIIARSLAGNNTDKWRKFDIEDVIILNNGQVNMNGKTQFEIVNIKPLGREIKIMFGKYSDMMVCYSGWLTVHDHQNLRVRVSEQGETKGCCFNIDRRNSPGEITANCSTGTIVTEIVDVQSANVDIGLCDQDVAPEASHTINKRNPLSQHFNRIVDDLPSNYKESRSVIDILGDRGPILFKREVTPDKGASDVPLDSPVEGNELFTSDGVVLPRRKGISKTSLYEQAQSINEFIAIIRNDINVEIRQPLTPRFQLLKKTFDVFLNIIPDDVVPNMLVQTAFDVFYFLYEELEPVIYTPPEIFHKTMQFLNKCLSNEKMLVFSTSGCPKQIDELVIDANVQTKVEAYYKDQPEELKRTLRALKTAEIRKDKRFIPEQFDIYVEINWKVADFVHSFCFDYFGKEFNAHTYYENELEELFLAGEVQTRWFTKRDDLRYVRGIFPVPNLKLSMKQLDKVTAIAHQLSRYNGSYWLERPTPDRDTIMDQNPILPYGSASIPNSEVRLIFVKNLLEEAEAQASNERKMTGSVGRLAAESSMERTLMYPFQYPTKLPAGELIWDGAAICLHAAYSDSKSYFVDSEMWGVTPSLMELGALYLKP